MWGGGNGSTGRSLAAAGVGDAHHAASPAPGGHHLPRLHQGCTQDSFQTGGKQVWEMPRVEKKCFGGGKDWPWGRGRAQRSGVLERDGLCMSAHHPVAKGGSKVFEGV